jgi:serine/threonine protein kinase
LFLFQNPKKIVVHENNAKIIDFGILKFKDIPTEPFARGLDMVAYVEPKRFSDPDFPYTIASDIYSFGVLMWEISSGFPPFKNSSISKGGKVALCISISNGEREKPIPDTPKEYEEIYKNCWNQEPNQRPIMSKILDEFAKMGFGFNSGKNQLMGGMYVHIIFLIMNLKMLNILIEENRICNQYRKKSKL